MFRTKASWAALLMLSLLASAVTPARALGHGQDQARSLIPAIAPGAWTPAPGRHQGGLRPGADPVPHRESTANSSEVRLPDTRRDTAAGNPVYGAPTTPQRMLPASTYGIQVAVTNTATASWAKTDIVLGHRWYLPDGSEYQGTRDPQADRFAEIPNDLQPGAQAAVTARVAAPDEHTGSARQSYQLAWDLYDRRTGHWLSEATPPVAQLRQPVTVEQPTSDLLGLEKFYQYTTRDAGGGVSVAVNAATGNAVAAWNILENPDLGPAAFFRLTYNSLDASTTVAGPGWSVAASTLTRLGSALEFDAGPLGGLRSCTGDCTFPESVRFVDGTGTTETFRLNRHGSAKPAAWDYDHPAGVHFYLQRTGSHDPQRSWVLTRPDRTQFFFDGDGRPSAVVDRNGNALTYQGSSGRLESVTDASGRRVLTLDYLNAGAPYSYLDEAGSLLSAAGLAGESPLVGQLSSVTDVSGRRIVLRYDEKGLLRQVTDGAGTQQVKTVSFSYEPGEHGRPRLVQITDPLGHATRLTYGDAGLPDGPGHHERVLSLTDRLGGQTRFDWTAVAEDRAVPRGDDGSPVRATVTDADGHATSYLIDGYGRPVESRDAVGEITRMTWDDDNNVRRLEEPGGAVTTWHYDPVTGYPLETTDAEQNKLPENQRASTGLVYRTGLGGHVADLVEKTSAEGRRWTFGYDAYGNMTSLTDPRGNTRGARPELFTSHNVYDSAGRLVQALDANGHVTRFADFTPTGSPERLIDAAGNTTRFRYDAVGNVLEVTDPAAHTSHYSYDVFHRPLESRVPWNTASSDPARQYITTPAPRYDSDDNILAAIAPNQAVTKATYNAAGQAVSVTEPSDSEPASPVRTTTYEYDLTGKMLRMTSPRGNLPDGNGRYTTEATYDELDRVVSDRDPLGGVTTYTYDAAGNVASVTRPRANVDLATTRSAPVPTQRFHYDLDHRRTETLDAEGHTVRTGYDRDGKVVSSQDQNGKTTTTVLDARGEPVEVRAPHDTDDSGKGEYFITRYEYDGVGNRTKTVPPRAIAENRPDLAETTVYDALNRTSRRLLPFDASGPHPVAQEELDYTYDSVGHLTSLSTPPSGSRAGRNTTTYTYFDNGWTHTSTDPWHITTTYDYNQIGRQTKRTLTGDDLNIREMSWSYEPDGKLKAHSDSGVAADHLELGIDAADQDHTTATGDWPTATAPGAWHGSYRHHDAAMPGVFTWLATPPDDGTFTVYAHWPTDAQGGKAAYTIQHEGGTDTVAVDQSKGGGSWQKLGSYTFKEGTEYRITLAADPAQPATGTQLLADAVKLTPEEAGGARDRRQYEYTYDPDGAMHTVADTVAGKPEHSWSVDTDPLGRTSAVREYDGTAGAPQSAAHTSTYTYDPDGNILQFSYDDKDNTTFAYDDLDRVQHTTSNGPSTDGEKATSYTWRPDNQLDTETKGNGNTVRYQRFDDGLVKQQTEKAKDSGAVVAEHTIRYDAAGNRKHDQAVAADADGGGQLRTTEIEYGYDARNRSVTVTKSTPNSNEEYWYDSDNDVTKQTIAEQTTTFDYDRNRLLSASIDGSTSRYRYDSFGRLNRIDQSAGPGESYRYDGFDRTVRHTSRGSTTNDTFDALDRRTSSTEHAGRPDAKTTAFHYLGLSNKLLTEETGGKITISYQQGAAGEQLSQVRFGDNKKPESSYFGYGPHNDVENITDEKGNPRATYGYTAYGDNDKKAFSGIDKPTADDPSKEPYNYYRFNAARWDGGSGVYNMGFRDYKPGLNQFLSRDMYNGALSDLHLSTDDWTMNRYAFVGGNPVTNIEDDGHRPLECAQGTYDCSIDRSTGRWDIEDRPRPAASCPPPLLVCSGKPHRVDLLPPVDLTRTQACSASTRCYDYTTTEDIGPISQTGSPENVMKYFQENPTKIFPFPITGCTRFELGTHCVLHANPIPYLHDVPNAKGEVELTSVTRTSFTFTVIDPKYFDYPGSTIKFSLKAENGELYLSQHGVSTGTRIASGTGLVDEIKDIQVFASLTWAVQARNLREALGLPTDTYNPRPVSPMNGVTGLG